ncbi:MAG: twin-arginine translocase TatA/TatE family subunit [Rhodospirillaceae bacterium]|jgi:sec-independent protein translocase protein TatA|nr:twin-arginine translocase TatA/TatE family subunit [Rhodospirillaceae bacterium]
MGTFSIWHWVVVLVIVLVLFGGRGKLSQLMGDMAKGITAFKKGLKEEDAVEKEDEPKAIKTESSAAASASVSDSAKKDEKV